MPEIKHSFTAGKMNKDLDERLVQNGEYRDAVNIQVRTTDGDSEGEGNAGVVQNIKGNTNIGSSYKTTGYDNLKTKFIGSVADEKNDKAYFLAAAPVPKLGILKGLELSDGTTGFTSLSDKPSRRTWVDSIIEVDTNTEESVPVVQDIFAVTASKFDLFYSNVLNAATSTFESTQTVDYPTGNYTSFLVKDASGIRPGMKVYAQRLVDGLPDDLLYEDATTNSEIKGVEVLDVQFDDSGTDDRIVLSEEQSADLSLATHFKFVHPERILNFDYYNLISSINIIDNLLFYTDGNDEPKKINIIRSKQGTESNNYTSDPQHTKLFVNAPPPFEEFVDVTEIEGIFNSDLKKEHVTVIRKKPTTAPHIFMQATDREFDVNFTLEHAFVDVDLVPSTPIIGTQRTISGINEDIVSSILIDDVLEFVDYTSNVLNPVTIRAKVIAVPGDVLSSDQIEVEMIFVDEDLTSDNTLFTVQLEQNKPLFETKFGRFSYRYQYEDNEYSAFAPWSELVFLPGGFLYTPSKGFNEGMTNNLRQLIIKNFIPSDSIRPADVKAVELLWKTTDDQSVYVVKKISREISSEWENFAYNNEDGDTTGFMQITSEMIHRVLESNQTLRTWDNVPKTAKAQEITGSRVVYGNYTQGYDITTPVGLKQNISSTEIISGFPRKSVKSIRKYRFGMVFGDKYGRETPVIADGYTTSENETTLGDVSVEKDLARFSNKFRVMQEWAEDITNLDWINYVKYYVKETSNEYYNLIMDRWYDAKDGCIWLSFPSADRNKVDEETYLILKNENGSQQSVTEPGRYKVIAIENEAPDYIKIDKRKFDLIEIDRNTIYDDVYNTNTGIPEGLANHRKIKIDPDIANEQKIRQTDFKGTPKVRIVAKWENNLTTHTYKSPYKTISKITEHTATVPGIHLKEVFTLNEVNAFNYFANVLGFAGSFNINEVDGIAIGDSVDGGPAESYEVESVSSYIHYYLEIVDHVVENKPEFDGRFFVKIEKDDILQKFVLKQTLGNFILTNQYTIGYINSHQNNAYTTNASITEVDANPDYSSTTWIDYDNTFLGFDGDDFDPKVKLGNQQGSTEAFLNWWGGVNQDPENGQRSSTIFIDSLQTAPYEEDEAHFWLQYPFTTINGISADINESYFAAIYQINGYLPSYNNSGSTEYAPYELGTYYYPRRLAGLFSTGNFYDGGTPVVGENAMFLGVIDNTFSGSLDAFGNLPALFKAQLQMEGTLFRFKDDPQQNVYRVKRKKLGNVYIGGVQGDNIWSNEVDLIANSWPNNDDSGYHDRRAFLVIFEKIDNETGEVIENVGINTDYWDPRASVQHNGVGAMTIEIVEAAIESDLEVESLATNSACWETEPKKDLGLDVYYEASNCIPFILKQDNIQPYVGASKNIKNASSFKVDERRSAQGAVTEVSLDTNTSALFYVNEVLGDDGIRVKKLTDDTESDLTTTSGLGVALEDVVAFTHKDGLITRAKVIDHYTIDSYDNVNVPKPVDRVVVTGTVNISNALQLDNNNVTTGNLANVNVGDNVIGNGIPSGTFVIGVDSSDLPDYAITLSQNAVQAGSNISISFVPVTGIFKLEKEVYKQPIDLAWFNCYSFGNGVESDRIGDDFNAPQIDNGCRVSSTFLEYGEEKIGSGMIYSGLYNSTSSINNLNEFNMAEKITKNLNPIYGSIQALKTRDTNVVVFAEDKVLKVLSNKDAVFNADGNPNLTATDKVLGQAIPFVGDYGISKNPESLAADNYRLYFTDKARGAVLRLSMDGLTPISNVGMKSYFREQLKNCDHLVGTFDTVNGEYNLTLAVTGAANSCTSGTCPTSTPQPITVSFNEGGKSWVSFKSFVAGTGVSVNGKYLTAPYGYAETTNNIPSNLNNVWVHHDDDAQRNRFYGQAVRPSEITVLFNDLPEVIKSFKSIGYEGSQSKISAHTTIDQETGETTFTDAAGNVIDDLSDGEYYNLEYKSGWYVDSISTDKQSGEVPDFINKENKWFNFIKGDATTLDNLDASEISVQGIGFPLSSIEVDPTEGEIVVQAEPLESPPINVFYYPGYMVMWINSNLGPIGGAPPYSYEWLVNGISFPNQYGTYTLVTYATIATIPAYADGVPDTVPITLTVTDTAGTSITLEANALSTYNPSNNL